MLFDLKLQRGPGERERRTALRDAMATEDSNKTGTGSVVLAQGTLPATAGTSPSPGTTSPSKHQNQESRWHTDKSQQSKRHGNHNGSPHSPSLLLYRKLPSDSEEGTFLGGECRFWDYSSKRSSGKEKMSQEPSVGKRTEGVTNTGSPLANSRSSPSPSTSPNLSPNLSPGHSPGPSSPKGRHVRRGSLPVSMLASRRSSSPGCSCSEPGSPVSSPSDIPLPEVCCRLHRNGHRIGHRQRDCLKDGYSSLERLNRRPRVKKYSLEKLFLCQGSPETMAMTTSGRDRGSSPGETKGSSGNSSSDDGEGLLDDGEFVRNRKERNTVLMRRFMKNNQKVIG